MSQLHIDGIEKPACEGKDEQKCAHKDGEELPAHDLLEHQQFRETHSHSTHTKSQRCSRWQPLEQKTFHDRYNACYVGIEGNAKRNRKWYRPELAISKMLGKPLFWQIAVQSRPKAYAKDHPKPDTAKNGDNFTDSKDMALGKTQPTCLIDLRNLLYVCIASCKNGASQRSALMISMKKPAMIPAPRPTAR